MYEAHFGMHVQELNPGKMIGMCTDDQCIPFDLKKNDKDAAFKENDLLYIPIVSLMEMLEGETVWNAKKNSLAVTYEH